MVRSFLGGAFANTAFSLLEPDGETRLTGSGRGPNQVLKPGRRGPRSADADDSIVIEEMTNIARRFRPKGDLTDQTLQDFHTFRQALNVASADQRLLLFVVSPETSHSEVKDKLQPVMADSAVIGRFHVDFADQNTDQEWDEKIQRSNNKSGYFIIRAGQFGQSGSVMDYLPLTSSGDQVKAALLEANREFADTEERKNYGDHVSLGRRERIYFENEMPYGEDRDGDGVIDHGAIIRQGSKGKGKGKGR